MTIYDIVEDLKEKYGTTDPFELCEYLGIKVSISPLGSLKGLYTYIDGVPVILISSAIKASLSRPRDWTPSFNSCTSIIFIYLP